MRLGRIWAVNVGENFGISREAWWRFCAALRRTNVGHMYASEHVLGVELKCKLIDGCRANRKRWAHAPDPAVAACVTHMWWNPPRGLCAATDSAGAEGAAARLGCGEKRCTGCTRVLPAAKKQCDACGFVMRKSVADRVVNVAVV